MKIESVNVTVFQYPTRRVSDSAGHSHPGAESMAKMAMLTITADDGTRGFSFAPPEVVRPFRGEHLFSQGDGGAGPV
ncbi:putative mandelate racemase / muconate lactonizing enzyme [Klebsiella grimontii]|uniref:Putative mandelate racemase / muconate lactonizing enzyme n=1 Tax=Klebsiella grimontii TaxID=2058152 RepID=A0A7H4P090_9ENTR|nr:putative mandelate racemase / muconate lactonizing enzyme [Klebsiella grimontii]